MGRPRFSRVVSYSISTSNHNLVATNVEAMWVVSYSISTSNHNYMCTRVRAFRLYLIPFLHQTTTGHEFFQSPFRCILFHFYIKPQQFIGSCITTDGCILFHFYIKPQPRFSVWVYFASCILFHFYIKPQPMAHKALFSSTLSPKSHSHFQRNAVV